MNNLEQDMERQIQEIYKWWAKGFIKSDDVASGHIRLLLDHNTILQERMQEITDALRAIYGTRALTSVEMLIMEVLQINVKGLRNVEEQDDG